MEADVIDTSFDGIDPEVMVVQAEAACDFMKALSDADAADAACAV